MMAAVSLQAGQADAIASPPSKPTDSTLASAETVDGRAASTLPGRPGYASAETVDGTKGQAPIDAQAVSAPSDAVLSPGTRIGDYVLGEPIGSGTFGTVYAAEHPVIQTPAAVKVLAWRYSADAQMVARFIDEARAVNRIQHPSIVRIFNFGRLPDMRRYHVMERLFGEGLDERLERVGRLSVPDAIAVLEPIAAGLAAAHAAGVIHRDVKPANVFVGQDGRAKLLDFGVAKLVDDATHAKQTATGVAVGTPAFMAPEQCLGEKIGPTVDIYALGVMAFCMLTGRLPFERESGFAMMAAHLNDPPPNLHDIEAELPPAMSRVVQQMMAKNPADRPQDPIAAVSALAAAGEEDAPPVPPSDSNRRWALTVGALLVLGLGIAFFATRESGKSVVADVTVVDAGRPDAGPLDAGRVVRGRTDMGRPDAHTPVVDAAPIVDAAPPDTQAAAPPSVQLTFDGLPPRARARFAGQIYDLAQRPVIKLPASANAARITFEAPRHRRRTVTIKRVQSGTHMVRLRPIRAATPTSKSPGSKGRKNEHGIDPWP